MEELLSSKEASFYSGAHLIIWNQLDAAQQTKKGHWWLQHSLMQNLSAAGFWHHQCWASAPASHFVAVVVKYLHLCSKINCEHGNVWLIRNALSSGGSVVEVAHAQWARGQGQCFVFIYSMGGWADRLPQEWHLVTGWRRTLLWCHLAVGCCCGGQQPTAIRVSPRIAVFHTLLHCPLVATLLLSFPPHAFTVPSFTFLLLPSLLSLSWILHCTLFSLFHASLCLSFAWLR